MVVGGIMDASQELFVQINEFHKIYLQLNYDLWIRHSLFTWRWWMLVLINIVPWYFWWRIVDKKRLLEIPFNGVITFVAVVASDAIGVAHGYWAYPIRLFPFTPHLLPADTTILPITFMLVYQFFTKWQAFLAAATVMAACLAFIGEPFAVWLGVYKLINVEVLL